MVDVGGGIHLLDTNIVSALARDNRHAKHRLRTTSASSVCISVLTEAEVLFGLQKVGASRNREIAATTVLKTFPILPWDSPAATRYAALRSELEREGRLLARVDLLIAAHALSINATLVSDDRALQRVPGLVLENWLLPPA